MTFTFSIEEAKSSKTVEIKDDKVINNNKTERRREETRGWSSSKAQRQLS